MTILIISHQKGLEADLIISELDRKGLPFFRLNQEEGNQVSQIGFAFPEFNLILKCDNRSVNLKEISSVWYQQLPFFEIQYATDNLSSIQRLNISAQFDALDYIIQDLGIKTLNSRSVVKKAGNKAVQLFTARQVGLPLLPTIVGNHFDLLRSFSELESSIFKNFASPWFENGKSVMAASTKRFSPDELLHEDSIIPCAAIYQKYSKRIKDYRVVVVDTDVFVGSVDSSAGGEYDVRTSSTQLNKYTQDSLPDEHIQALLNLMKKLGLQYCAADFILTNSGEYFFLELNTCGSWWWINELYNNAIVEAIVAYLA